MDAQHKLARDEYILTLPKCARFSFLRDASFLTIRVILSDLTLLTDDQLLGCQVQHTAPWEGNQDNMRP